MELVTLTWNKQHKWATESREQQTFCWWFYSRSSAGLRDCLCDCSVKPRQFHRFHSGHKYSWSLSVHLGHCFVTQGKCKQSKPHERGNSLKACRHPQAPDQSPDSNSTEEILYDTGKNQCGNMSKGAEDGPSVVTVDSVWRLHIKC